MMKFKFKDALLTAITAIIFLRLIIWKLMPNLDLFLKEDGSNILIASLIFLVAVVLGVSKIFRREAFSKTGFEWPMGVMSIAAVLSLFYTADVAVTLRLVISFLAGVALFIILVDCLDSPSRRKFFLWAMVAGAVLTAVFAIKDFFVLMSLPMEKALAQERRDIQYIMMNRRVTSFIGWPNSLAGYLLLSFPFIGLGAFFSQGWKKWSFVAMGVLTALGLLFTFSFLGWTSLVLASLLMVPFMMTFLFRSLPPRMKMVMIATAVVLGLLFVVVIVRKNFTSAVAPRKVYYEHTLKLIAQKPFLGHGFGTYGQVSRPLVSGSEGITNYPHNTYLQWWLEAGLLGFAGMIWFLCVFAMLLRRVLARGLKEPEAWINMALGWGLLAFFIDNVFSFTFIKPNIAVHGWAFLALFTAFLLSQEKKPKVQPKQAFYPTVLTVFSVIIMFVISWDMCLGCLWYYKGSMALRSRDLNTAGQAFVQGSLFDRWSAAYPVAAGNLAVQIFRSSGKEYHLRLAEVNFLEAVRREPLLYSNHYMLSDIYARLGDRETSIKYARQAKELSPFEYTASVQRNQMRKAVK